MSLNYVAIGFFAMLGMMLLGLPIATSMAVVGIVGGMAAYGLPFIDSIAPVIWGVHNDNLLTSVPLFVLMGELLLRSGIADRMFGALAAWLGRLPGGLLHTNIGCSALFAATSGSSVATAATVGTVALPSLHKRGYPMHMSLGSIAAGCTPLALGTDGGGSIRRPASHCGLVGFKPSIGAIARGDGLPSLLLDFEVVGPMARSVADARLMFEVLRGPHPTDRASLACEAAAALSQRPRQSRAPRVLYVPTLSGAPVNPAISAACADAASRLRDLGFDVETGDLPLSIEALSRQWPQVGQIGLAAMFNAMPAWRELASPKYRDMAAQGDALGAAALWQLLESVEQLRRDCAHLFESVDLIAMPSAAALPWPAQEAFPPAIAGQAVGPRGHAVFTGWVNAAGLPAVSVPVAASAACLPIGLQLIGAYGADDAVLEAAAAFERLCPWTHLRPPL